MTRLERKEKDMKHCFYHS